MTFCYADGCEREAFCKGLCGKHYKRLMKGQDVNAILPGQQSMAHGELEALGLHKHHPFYLAWCNMKTRCDNPNSTQYPWYGAKGVTYDVRWKGFRAFYEDMWPTWQAGLTLERNHPFVNYNKDNCSWATWSEQANNRRTEYV